MHIIVLKDGKYLVKKPMHLPNPEFDFFAACDILREALSTFDKQLWKFVMNDGSGLFFDVYTYPKEREERVGNGEKNNPIT